MHILVKTDLDSLEQWLKDLKEFQLDSMFDTHILGRAYLYTNAVSIEKKDDLNIFGRVKEKDYQMQIWAKNNFVHAKCSCPYNGPCKHLAALLLVCLPNTDF
ncbi:MAG: SWIM zinc finger family protein [Bacteroidota bacterium]